MSERIHSLPKSLCRFIFYFVKKQFIRFGILLVTGVFWSVNESFYPYFMKILINQASTLTLGLEHPFRALAFPLIGLGVTWFLFVLAVRIQDVVSVYAFPLFRQHIREHVFAYTQGHAHRYFSEHFTGDLANKIASLPRACEHILDIVISNFFCTLLSFTISLVVVFQVSAVFGMLLFCFVVLFVLLTILNMGNINRTAETHAKAIAALDGQIVDSLSAMLTVRLFARSRYELQYLKKCQKDEFQKSIKASWAIVKANVLRGMLTSVFMTLTFFTLVRAWNQNWISIGDFSLITMTFFNLAGMIWHSSFHITQIAKEIGVSKAALSLINTPYSVVDLPQAKPLLASNGVISFDKIVFHYTNDKTVLFDNLSITIQGGQKVGLVGFSGSGKTTFAHLILRLFDVHGGTICIDGQNIATVAQDTLREQIAMIPQDPTLFHRTIFENIHYGRLTATKAEVIEAARLAHCMQFVEQLADGLQTMVGERGIKLSGGQRQRIAIARAILKNAPILIMDEATAALDSVTEKFIQGNLKDIMHHRTTLVIAHRLSTLLSMDRILVFDQGVILEDGSVSELLAREGRFAQLWKMQAGGFLPDQENV